MRYATLALLSPVLLVLALCLTVIVFPMIVKAIFQAAWKVLSNDGLDLSGKPVKASVGKRSW